jgi:hypothetical protein
MILTNGEQPLDLITILKEVKTKKIIHYLNGTVKVIIDDKNGIEKLKRLGFT